MNAQRKVFHKNMPNLSFTPLIFYAPYLIRDNGGKLHLSLRRDLENDDSKTRRRDDDDDDEAVFVVVVSRQLFPLFEVHLLLFHSFSLSLSFYLFSSFSFSPSLYLYLSFSQSLFLSILLRFYDTKCLLIYSNVHWTSLTSYICMYLPASSARESTGSLE